MPSWDSDTTEFENHGTRKMKVFPTKAQHGFFSKYEDWTNDLSLQVLKYISGFMLGQTQAMTSSGKQKCRMTTPSIVSRFPELPEPS